MSRMMWCAVLLLAGCKAGEGPVEEGDSDADTDTDTDSDTDADADSDSDTDTDTEDTDIGPPLEVDCSSLPQPGLTMTRLDAPRAYHGIAFDPTGFLIGWDGTSVIRATSPSVSELWVPNVGLVEQMDILPDGDLASTGGGAIVRVAPDGAATVLASGINAYGLEVGPDGFIYTANQNVVHRVDPVNGGATVVVPSNQISTPKVVNFSPDGTLMYVGTNFGSGEVYEIDLDANFDPIFPPRLLANTGGSWHDGLGVDACGNLYVAEFVTSNLYLITPSGEVSTLVNYGGTGAPPYGHGIQWGGGVGSWSDHNIYVPLPYDGDHVAEIELGIPGRDYNGGNYITIP